MRNGREDSRGWNVISALRVIFVGDQPPSDWRASRAFLFLFFLFFSVVDILVVIVVVVVAAVVVVVHIVAFFF